MRYWNSMPEWARWVLYFPVVISIGVFGPWLATVPLRIAIGEGKYGDLLLGLIQAIIAPLVTISAAANFAPRWKKAWMVLWAVVLFFGVVWIFDEQKSERALLFGFLSLSSMGVTIASCIGMWREPERPKA